MRHNLRTLRVRRGWRLEDAARAFGLSAKGYEKLEYSTRKLSLERLNQAAEIYKVSVLEVVSAEHEVQIVGTVTHGGIVLYGTNGDIREIAPRPEGATQKTVALLVGQGVTVPGIAIENYILYHDDMVDGVPLEYLEKLCFVEADDGVTYVRRIYRGSQPENYDLVGVGFETMRNVRVKRSALLTWLKPR